MKKLLLFSLFITSLFAVQTQSVLKVSQERDKSIVETISYDLKVGEEAYIVRESGEITIIGQRCTVKSVQYTRTTLECERFTRLDKESMPKIRFEAKVGDKVVINPFNKRGLIVTTSQENYLKTKKELKEYDFIHPDLLAITLVKDSNPFPDREDFQNFCDEYYVNTLFFDLEESVIGVNCMTFAEVYRKNRERKTDQETTKPFFHRLEKIEKGFWNFIGAHEIENFDTYYKGLIHAK